MFDFAARRLPRHWLIIGFCLSLFAGILVARVWLLEDARWLWLVVCALPVVLRRHHLSALVLLSVLGFGLGWWRASGVRLQQLSVGDLYKHKVVVVGTVDDDAVYGQHYQLEFTLSHVSVVLPRSSPFTGSLTVSGFGETAIYRGDTIQVSGTLSPTLGNNVGAIRYADLHVLARDHSWLNAVRRAFVAGMQSALPEPLAPFAMGLLIGQRSTLPSDISEQLKRVGLTHVIAVSGYNLTIIIVACRRLLSKTSKYQIMAACATLTIVFLLLTGLSPPIIRASVICWLSLWSWYYGRRIKPLVLLLVSGAITVVASPAYLWGNVSWYLSFLSFFGVVVLGPLVTKRIFGEREPKLLAAILLETICATVLVLPYALWVFGQASIISLVANVLVVPLIPLAMLLALIAGLGGMLTAAVAGWFAWPAVLVLTYMLDISAMLSHVPHSFVENVGFSWRAMAVCYATILLGLFILQLKVRNISGANLRVQGVPP